jgi:hypothetical protein
MRDQQNILQQQLGPLQEEAVRIIGELTTMQGKFKQEAYEAEEKITGLNYIEGQGDHINKGRDNQRSGGRKDNLPKFCWK